MVGVALPVLAATGSPAQTLYVDVTSTNIPFNIANTMDAAMADLDADGDLDIVLAMEFQPNILLVNDGSGVFTDQSSERLPIVRRDSEDVGVADVDGDGDPDLVFVTEDDLVNELYLNDRAGRFRDASGRIGDTGRSNALEMTDIDGDGDVDLVIGNAGPNRMLLNDGNGWFAVDPNRLPGRSSVTQDLDLADVDGDGDLDMIEANEGDNVLLLNDGSGHFSDAPGRIPLRATREETREADFGDVDCDGDPDLYFANTRLFVSTADPRNRLLINDGTGRFSDESAARLPDDELASYEVDFLDVDCDGDLDILTGNGLVVFGRAGPKTIVHDLYKVYLNDGEGFFHDGTDEILPPTATGIGFDIAAGDVDGDGAVDLYLAGRETRDRLVLSTAGRCFRPACPRSTVRQAGARLAP